MNFDLTEDQREIKRTARDFLAARYTPEKIRAIALDGAAGPALGRDRRAGLAGRGRARDRRARGRGRGARLRARAVAAGRALGGEAAASRRLEGRGTVAMWDADGDGRSRGADAAGRRRPLTGVEDRRARTPTWPTRSSSPPRAGGTSRSRASDATIEPARALDATRPLFTVRFDGAPGEELDGDFGRAWHAIAVMAAAESVGVAARVTRRHGRLRQGAQAVRPRDRLLPGRLARLRADVPRDRGRPLGHLLGRVGARPRPRERLHGGQLREGLRVRRRGQRRPLARCRSTAASASPGSTTCTCSSSAPRPTRTRSATPAGTASRSRPRCSRRRKLVDGGAAWSRRRR